MPQIAANGLHFEYDITGEGEPLLLIMGLGGQMTLWRDVFVAKLAARGYRVIRFDNRDIGLSEKLDHLGPPDMGAVLKAYGEGRVADAPYNLSDMADDAAAVLTALGIDRAHIVGASMGGMIAQLVAADHPEKTLSLTSIMSTTGNRDLPPAKPEAMAVLGRPAPDPTKDMEGFLASGYAASKVIGSPGYPAEEAEYRAFAKANALRSYYPVGFQRQYAAVLASPDRRAKLATISVPTLVIHGEDDPLVPIEGGRDTAANIPGAELLTIPGMGHDVPPALYDTLVEAIDGVARRTKATA
ncbi:MAG TPA: alpha/beta hydrolase [Caulobacteraceae bacterium]|jgi:pimeloyl-ACP methyl ester carboxylesterase